jgi:general secretion pathway protein G
MYIPANVQRLPFRARRRIFKRLAREAERQRMRMFSPSLQFSRKPVGVVLILAVMALVGGLLVGKVRQADFGLGPAAAAREDLQVLMAAVEEFRKDCGRYPRADEGLEALMHDPDAPGWNGPYLNVLRPDPWRHRYGYRSSDDRILIQSNGPDGTQDTADDIVQTGGGGPAKQPEPSSRPPDRSG